MLFSQYNNKRTIAFDWKTLFYSKKNAKKFIRISAGKTPLFISTCSMFTYSDLIYKLDHKDGRNL